MDKAHLYRVTIQWVGNLGVGTSDYRSYSRNHSITTTGKAPIEGSSDPAFRGESTRWNPEELLVASLSACHKLWYLHLCADVGITVVTYLDHAQGIMSEDNTGSGQFKQVTLRPHVSIKAGQSKEKATNLHHKANSMCFIARSVGFPVLHEPVTVWED